MNEMFGTHSPAEEIASECIERGVQCYYEGPMALIALLTFWIWMTDGYSFLDVMSSGSSNDDRVKESIYPVWDWLFRLGNECGLRHEFRCAYFISEGKAWTFSHQAAVAAFSLCFKVCFFADSTYFLQTMSQTGYNVNSSKGHSSGLLSPPEYTQNHTRKLPKPSSEDKLNDHF